MLLKLLFLTLLFYSTLIGVIGARNDVSCAATAGPIESCSQFIYSNCENATFIGDRHAYSDHCPTISLFWDAPMYNMSILFQSRLTKPYSICMQPVGCTKAYRTLDDGKEVLIKWDTFNSGPVCFKTERSDRPTMKFRFDAGNVWHCYGTFIRFSYQF